ncbi:MAG: hypothetical protein H7234_03840 [Herminiimonas sp.]|nr:hypothetical protein [Herminiimonas sp.]
MSQLAKLLIASALLATTAASIAQNTGASNSMTMPAGSAGNAGTVITPMVNPNAAGMPPDSGAAGASGTAGATAAGTTSGTTSAGAAASGASATGATAASTSADPYVQKREADAIAKKEYKAKKKAAKAEYKHEKAAAKSDMKMEKRESTADRNSAIAADPAKTVVPGQQNNLGK